MTPSETDNILVEGHAHQHPDEAHGRWVERNPDKKYLTHESHIGRVAAHLTDAHPEGWRFVIDRTDRRGKAGHFEYFVPDNETDS